MMLPPLPSPIASIIETLPTELLSQIFSFLDGPSPSDTRLHDQPTERMLMSDYGDALYPKVNYLKQVSLVNKRFRSVAFPILFRKIIWTVNRQELSLVEQDTNHPAAKIALLEFLGGNNLGAIINSFTMLVGDNPVDISNRHQTSDGEGRLGRRPKDVVAEVQTRGNNGYNGGEGSSGNSSLRDNISDSNGSAVPRHQQFEYPPDEEPGHQGKTVTFNKAYNWLWDTIFGMIDPLRFTIIASPRVLGSLLSRMLYVRHAQRFQTPLHILSLSRRDRRGVPLTASGEDGKGKGKSKDQDAKDVSDDDYEPLSLSMTNSSLSDPSSPSSTSSLFSAAERNRESDELRELVNNRKTTLRRVPCRLFTIRPWTDLLLNEGSSLSVYRNHNFFVKRPPSILGALLGTEEFPNNEALIPATVRSLAYVGIFPLSMHVVNLVRHLPRLDRLFIQLVPRNDILDDAGAMSGVNPADLWVERNATYSTIMRSLLAGGRVRHRRGNWRFLREFESGDAADRDAWDMAVQYMRLAGKEWRVAGDGVFVRREPGEKEDGGDGNNASSSSAHPSEPGMDVDGDNADSQGGLEVSDSNTGTDSDGSSHLGDSTDSDDDEEMADPGDANPPLLLVFIPPRP